MLADQRDSQDPPVLGRRHLLGDKVGFHQDLQDTLSTGAPSPVQSHLSHVFQIPLPEDRKLALYANIWGCVFWGSPTSPCEARPQKTRSYQNPKTTKPQNPKTTKPTIPNSISSRVVTLEFDNDIIF